MTKQQMENLLEELKFQVLEFLETKSTTSETLEQVSDILTMPELCYCSKPLLNPDRLYRFLCDECALQEQRSIK